MNRFAIAILVAFASSASDAQPLYLNSVVSNDLDFIRSGDPGACWSIAQTGVGRTEMYDPRTDRLFVDQALHFDVRFARQVIRLNLHPGVKDPAKRAAQVAASLSRLPRQMRRGIRYVNILDGEGRAWEEGAGGFFTLYDALIERRLREHDLDETVFHEAVHVALDRLIAKDPDWLAAQTKDGGFVTQYAADNPTKEDVAETALFAWTLAHHPGRLPVGVERALRALVPNRLHYLKMIFAKLGAPSC